MKEKQTKVIFELRKYEISNNKSVKKSFENTVSEWPQRFNIQR